MDSKLILQLYEAKNKVADGKTISQTNGVDDINDRQDRDAENEWERLDLCAHENVLRAFVMACTDRGNKVILIERAAKGDVKSHHDAIEKVETETIMGEKTGRMVIPH